MYWKYRFVYGSEPIYPLCIMKIHMVHARDIQKRDLYIIDDRDRIDH